VSTPIGGDKGFLLLEDGTLFHGIVRGPQQPAVAEVVFTTNMTGYQEVFSDPSYTGQIVTMTTPMIGNYGVNSEDPESDRPQVAGIIVRELSRSYANWRAEHDLAHWLLSAGVPILEGVDTRRLTRLLRAEGAMRGVIGHGETPDASARAALAACPNMEGLDLATGVSTHQRYTWGSPDAGRHIVALDFGIKRNILRLFENADCRVTVVPSRTSASEIMELDPDGIFLSNGPGDPFAVDYAPATIRALATEQIPVFGICLGHQLIGLSFGAKTIKLPFGHHGGNHPVRDLETDTIQITSQNHGFAVQGTAEGIPGAPALEVTHINLNDATIEGVKHRELPIFAVQYHPEAAPGPHDARYLFGRFLELLPSRVR
jgi:carbamoyl-phosphate synthase small subunit